MSKDDSIWTFVKLIDSDNYKQWSRQMQFALINFELWLIVFDKRIKFLVDSKLTEDEKKKVEKKIKKWDEQDERVFVKMTRMSIDIVQLTISIDWSSTIAWNELKTRNFSKEWTNKWEIATRLQNTILINCKNMQEFEIALKKIDVDIANLDIIAKNIVVFIALNFLDSQYKTWVIMLSQKVRDDKKLFDLDSLFENLRQKKHRHNQFEKINLACEKWNREDREDREDERDEDNENNLVDDNERDEEREERDKENDREDRENDDNVAESENDSQSSKFEFNNNCKNCEKNHFNKSCSHANMKCTNCEIIDHEWMSEHQHE